MEKMPAQLDELGPQLVTGNLAEIPLVVQQRNALNRSKKQLDDAVKRAQAIRAGAFYPGQQIGDLRRLAFATQLAQNTRSMLGSNLGFLSFNRLRRICDGWTSSITP
ncbi:hypothetical protein LTK23_24050 [Klebsiella quasipneumoniae subsp. quasipneumoniae]|uniref:hypothetical protein n=1 Tax=Klebsiella quasipneumoniae TaxID=1463165 RepID=UPI001E2A1BDD|nr:hypothetical protein [Klebsiella quasipneumoniae]MCD7096461.1 hypothetical protein [Klebsiella quasipneumoniae subsp. similipneumoniae]